VDSCSRLDEVREKGTLCASGAVVGDRQQGSTPQNDRQGGKHFVFANNRVYPGMLRFEAARPMLGSGASRSASVRGGSGSERSKALTYSC
jgi:hypothetical protein